MIIHIYCIKYHQNFEFSMFFFIYFCAVSKIIFPIWTLVLLMSIFEPDSICTNVPNFALLSNNSNPLFVNCKKQCFLLMETSYNFTYDSWPLPILTTFFSVLNLILIWMLLLWDSFGFCIPYNTIKGYFSYDFSSSIENNWP